MYCNQWFGFEEKKIWLLYGYGKYGKYYGYGKRYGYGYGYGETSDNKEK